MTAFIRQEALEKAREIQLKADEEFAIEKSKLVREETTSIDKEYEKKFKQASMSQQITRSTMSNKTRLKVLSARQSLLDDLFEQTRDKVGKASEGKDYDAILKGLILEGMYMLNEKKLIVRCRKADQAKVEKAGKEAGKEYKDNMGTECVTSIDEKNMLPDESYVFDCRNKSQRDQLTQSTGKEASSWQAVAARSSWTTPSKHASSYARPTLCPAPESRSSERTITGNSTIETSSKFAA
jgi:V-type H+-transporting ATPase subunit E